MTRSAGASSRRIRPHAGQTAELAQVRRNLALEAQAQARAEALAVAQGVSETLALEEARGATFVRPKPARGERAKPTIRLDGLSWLASKGRLTPRQAQAGWRYGRLVQILEGGDVSSCLNLLEVRGSGPRPSPTDAKVWARAKLSDARGALGDHAGLIFALDQVCALGKRPREITTEQRASERLEDRLGVGLDLLVRHWGL